MKPHSIFAFVLVVTIANLNAPGCSQQQRSGNANVQTGATPNRPTKTGNQNDAGNADGGLKVLASGVICKVVESYIFVARDVDSYQQLRGVIEGLPAESPEFFQSQAVVAAFLGQRMTGGFDVNIAAADGGLRILERTPPKGAMVNQLVTTPYRIVAFPLGVDASLKLTLDQTWRQRFRPYSVSGTMRVGGGFAGIQQDWKLTGKLQIMRVLNLVTIFFEVEGQARETRRLQDVASGTADGSGGVILGYFNSASLTMAVQSPFQATGQFDSVEQSLALELQTVPNPKIADNLAARGSIRATATAGAPPNRARY